MAELINSGTIGAPARLMVIGGEVPLTTEIAGTLEAGGYQVSRLGPSDNLSEAVRREAPALLILAVSHGFRMDCPLMDARTAAHHAGIPVLEVFEHPPDLSYLTEGFHDADDWVLQAHVADELAPRVARLIRRTRAKGIDPSDGRPGSRTESSALPIDNRFWSLVVHDMRTPLNVISLSLRMIEQAMPKGDPELDEDFRFVDDNFKQIERMLTQLSDYCRLFGPEVRLNIAEFSPQRLINELTENRRVRGGAKASPIRLDIRPDCPAEVSLDEVRARIALEYALENAATAASGAPFETIVRGGPDRWIIELQIHQPPPSSVQSFVLDPHRFERLCGIAAERRGMDLAIAARVTQLFGGSAKVSVDDRSSTLRLEWPARLAES